MSEFQEISDGLENVGEGIARLQAENASLRALNEELVGALEHTRDNFMRLLEQKPVRDAAETLAEADRALSNARAKGGSHG